jgi:hypothetical protein
MQDLDSLILPAHSRAHIFFAAASAQALPASAAAASYLQEHLASCGKDGLPPTHSQCAALPSGHLIAHCLPPIQDALHPQSSALVGRVLLLEAKEAMAKKIITANKRTVKCFIELLLRAMNGSTLSYNFNPIRSACHESIEYVRDGQARARPLCFRIKLLALFALNFLHAVVDSFSLLSVGHSLVGFAVGESLDGFLYRLLNSSGSLLELFVALAFVLFERDK